MTTFKIHPAIGIARVGNSDEFYLAPEQPGALPIQCDPEGREERDEDGAPRRVSEFKQSDDLGMVKRQGARFRVFAYTDHHPEGVEIKVGDSYEFLVETSVTGRFHTRGKVTDISWTAHIANKKSSWYAFLETDGMHGYGPGHPLRNPDVIQPDARRQLIIDPGPQTVSYGKRKASRSAEFTRGKNPGYAQSFPPPDISPNAVDTLGEMICHKQDDHVRLVVLGGRGSSGSTRTPIITSFVNNDGWFDDVGDGPVSAVVHFEYEVETTDAKGKKVKQKKQATQAVDANAWVVVGYPRFAPEILDMITMDEAMYDLFVRHFAYAPQIFGRPPFDAESNAPQSATDRDLWRAEARFNTDYYPKFYGEIWPILQRPNAFGAVLDFDYFQGGDPHNTGTGGNLDETALGAPPTDGGDPHRQKRRFVYGILRKPGGENLRGVELLGFGYMPRAMPEACGNNPISNTAPDKFLRLTDTQLFLLSQWAEGKFINEAQEWGERDPDVKTPWAKPPTTGVGIDRGVLSNALGGAFCPGGELSWIILNPAIYSAPYRIAHGGYMAGQLSLPGVVDPDNAAHLDAGMQPGDLTKYTGVPWQADFHECTTQDIDLTYEDWNQIDLGSTGDPAKRSVAYSVPWWPAHRPVVVTDARVSGQVYWASGLPPNHVGDLRMVTAWKDMGFLKNTASSVPGQDPGMYQVERNDAAVGPPVRPGGLTLGSPSRRRDG